MLSQLLEAEGIDHHPVAIGGITRESFVVYEVSSSLQYRFTLPGPMLTRAEACACLDAAFGLNPAYLVVSGSLPAGIPLEIYVEIANCAQERGIRVILDSAVKDLHTALDAGVYLIKPNLRELESLAGAPLADEAQIENAGKALLSQGIAQAILISLGAGGAILITHEASHRIHAPVVPIASKVGAGDSMVGGLVMALAQSHSLPDAARFGVAAGSAAVMTPGTQLCRRDDAYRLYDSVTLS